MRARLVVRRRRSRRCRRGRKGGNESPRGRLPRVRHLAFFCPGVPKVRAAANGAWPPFVQRACTSVVKRSSLPGIFGVRRVCDRSAFTTCRSASSHPAERCKFRLRRRHVGLRKPGNSTAALLGSSLGARAVLSLYYQFPLLKSRDSWCIRVDAAANDGVHFSHLTSRITLSP